MKPLVALVLAACACACPGAAFAQTAAPIEQPRPFGHVIGELLTQRVRLPNGFEPAALPGAARIGVWLERRPLRIETGADGQRWLVVEHQLINAPRERADVTLPALELRSSSGAALTLPAFTVGVVALASGASAPELGSLRPDRGAPQADTDTPRRRALALAAAAALTLALWAAWFFWRNARDAARRPFARAFRELQGLDAATPQAWQALHAAFDRSAGRVLHGGSLDALFRARPEFAVQRGPIERFYAQSATRFFDAGDTPPDAPQLKELCRTLRRIERQVQA